MWTAVQRRITLLLKACDKLCAVILELQGTERWGYTRNC